MTEAANITIGLDKSGKKFNCPQCGKKRFVRMYDFEAKEYLPEEVGRCDRESSCGYHMTAKQYFESIGKGYKPVLKEIEVKPEVVDFMPVEYVKQSMSGYEKSNFASWLTSLFGETIADKTLLKYLVGRSKNDNGKACIFWRIDKEGKVRTGKIMCYNPETGKRNKDAITTWVHALKNERGQHLFTQPYNFKLCFFGEHLLDENPEKVIGIVESEKTAVIASIFKPDMVWLATGGNSGCKWREWAVFNVLKDRNVVMFPDFGYFNKKIEKTCFDEWLERAEKIKERMPCNIQVSSILEDSLGAEERANDFDLADLLIKRNDNKGLCLTDHEYPAIIDLYPAHISLKVSDYEHLINKAV